MPVIIRKLNSSFLQIKNYDKDLLILLKDNFIFYSPGYKYNPRYKMGHWDGLIHLFNSKTDTLPLGLFRQAYKLISSYTKDIICDLTLFDKGFDVSKEDIIEMSKFMNMDIVPYDHQIEAITKCLKHKRLTIESATSSGKSLILFFLCNFLKIKRDDEKILIVVPTTQLVEQMTGDFKDYAKNYTDYSKFIKKVYSGVERQTSKEVFIYISTWQSIISMKDSKESGVEKMRNLLSSFTTIINDEVHLATASSLSEIVSSCVNADFKIGVTGSLSNERVHEFQLNGLFGPTERIITAREMIDQGMSADFDITGIILDYHIDKRIELKNSIDKVKRSTKNYDLAKYNTELNYIRSLDNRVEFICNFSKKLKHNSILLFRSIEYGTKVYTELYKNSGKKVFYIDGKTKVSKREEIREYFEKHDGCLLIASLKTTATGINIKNVHNAVFIEPIKSEITVVQSIGRLLRKLADKKAVLYDITDDLSMRDWTNYGSRHFKSRSGTYKKEKHNLKVVRIKI